MRNTDRRVINFSPAGVFAELQVFAPFAAQGIGTPPRQNAAMPLPHSPAPPPQRPSQAPTPAVTPITHYENFPVASWLCPAHLRAPIAAIYHFARTADDLADEGEASAAARLDDLAAYRAALDLACVGQVAQDGRWTWVFGPLRQAIAAHHLPPKLLHALLDAFVQDIEKTRDGTGYANEAALLDYCQRSANPVGRLLLHLYGVADAQSLAWSDGICSALQLINFWQDPSRDLPRALLLSARRLRPMEFEPGGPARPVSCAARRRADCALRPQRAKPDGAQRRLSPPGARARRVGAAPGGARRIAHFGQD